MRQKVFCLGDDFQIKDEHGEDAFVVNGKAFSIAKQLVFRDCLGNTLLSIDRKLFSWGPTYEILKGDNLIATVKRERFTLISSRFSIDIPGGAPYEAAGDILNHEYIIYRNEQPITTVSKQWFAISDTYGVDIAENQDAVLILAFSVVIDMVCHPDHK